MWQLSLGNSSSRITHFEFYMLARLSQRDVDFTFERKLESVREQIEDDLLPHFAIDVDLTLDRRAVNYEVQGGLFSRGTKQAGKFGCKPCEIEHFVNSFDATCFDAREIKQRVYEFKETNTISVRHSET